MPTDRAGQAHAIVAALGAGGSSPASSSRAWRLDRSAVVDRLHELVAEPSRVRQGRLNLCGPAVLFMVWLEHDPVAAVTYAAGLFEDGRASIGLLAVTPSAGLRYRGYGRTERGLRCPQADWMMMAALRDSSNRVLRYSRQGGLTEAAAAITMPGTLRRWLGATGLFAQTRDETTLVLRKGIGHARQLVPSLDRELALLVALEMFRNPPTFVGRAHDRIVSLVPNHWVLLRSPIVPAGPGQVTFRFWSWGAEHSVVMDRTTFTRGYHGCLDAQFTLRAAASGA